MTSPRSPLMIPYEQIHSQLPLSPLSAASTSIISTTSLFDHPPDPQPFVESSSAAPFVQLRAGGGYVVKVNQHLPASITTGLATSTCPVDLPSPPRRETTIDIKKNRRARRDVVSLLFLNCASSLLDSSSNHRHSKRLSNDTSNSSDTSKGDAEIRAPLPPPSQAPSFSTSSNNRVARFLSPKARNSFNSLASPSKEDEEKEGVVIAVPTLQHHSHNQYEHFQAVSPLSATLVLPNQSQSRVLPANNGLLIPTASRRNTSIVSPTFTTTTSSLSHHHHQYKKTIKKSGGTTIASTPISDFEAEIKIHVDRFYTKDLERSILLVEQKQRGPICIATSASTTTSETTTTNSSTSSSSTSTTGNSNDCASSLTSLRQTARPPQQLKSILRSRQSKNTMRHISWQDQGAVASRAGATATASSVVSSTTSSALYVPSIATSIARESSASSSSNNTSTSDKENNSRAKDTISRYTPRNTTPTSSSSSSSVAATSTTSTLYNNIKNNDNSNSNTPQFILEPSDLWSGAVQFDPRQIQELFVEMCFFARLGFVQPPCCLQCTYRDCNDTSPTPTNNHQNHHRHPNACAAAAASNSSKSHNVRSCQRWVVWRKDANTLLHPNLLDGNVLIVQCQAAQRLLAGDQVDGCYWDAENKQVTRCEIAPANAAAPRRS
jgi:hypothetical protein